jgi:hypothetical protein
MTDSTARLRELGDALYEATSADLERSASSARRRPRLLAGLGAAAVLIPAGAVAATALLSTDDVAKSLPAGTLALVGTNPTCEVVVDQVEYRCVLDKPPGPIGGGSATATELPSKRYSVQRVGPQERKDLKIGEGVEVIPGPSRDAAEAESWLGAAEPSVDATNHVNGGCRALDDAGMTWRCYIGEAAVEERIISRQFLGERVRGPGVG